MQVNVTRTHCAGLALALTCLVAAGPADAAAARSSRRAKAALPPSSTPARFACRTAAKSASPASSRSPADKAQSSAALTAVIAGRDVTLSRRRRRPDRYGRQPAFVLLAGSDTPVQSLLLAQGEALVSAEVTDKDCAAVTRGRRG